MAGEFTVNDIYELIAKRMETMSKTQRKIAEYILNHRMEIAFLNVKQLAGKAEVSDASIIRFANFLGYTGYSQLQQVFQECTQNKWNGIEQENSQDGMSGPQIIETIYMEEIHHIQKTLGQLDTKKFFEITDRVVKAKRIFIVCARSSRSLGSYFHHNLNILLGNVYLLDSFDGNEEVFSSLSSEDVVIGITFKRYSKTTVDLVEYANRKDTYIVAITDYMTSPIVKYAENYLLVETRSSDYVDSFVAPQVLLNALITYIGKSRTASVEERVSEYKEVCDAFHLYTN